MPHEPRRLVSFERADKIALKPVDWLIDGWLVRDTLAGMVGPSGSCKSFLALDWALRVATGSPWFGRPVRRGSVFVLAGEGRSGIKKRIDGWSRSNGIPIEGAPLYVSDGLPGLCDLANTAAVMEAIAEFDDEVLFNSGGAEPLLVVVDTLARAMAGNDENSAQDMGAIVASMDQIRQHWGCCVLSVHHTGLGNDTQERARGSSAYRAALDSEFVLRATVDAVIAKGTKAKDWAPPLPLQLAKHVVPVLVPTERGQVEETTLVLRDGAGMVLELDQREMVLELADRGVTVREIEQRTGIAKSTVGRWIKARACPTRDLADAPKSLNPDVSHCPPSQEGGTWDRTSSRGTQSMGQMGQMGQEPQA